VTHRHMMTYKYVRSWCNSSHTCHIVVYTMWWHFSGPYPTGTIRTKPGHFGTLGQTA